MRREIGFTEVFNFRDVGGYPTMGGRSVRWRRLFRSDAPSHLSGDDRTRFGSLGIRTVVDLRRTYEIERQGRMPDLDGIAYRHIDLGHREWQHAPYRPGADPARYFADRYLDMADEGAHGLAETIRVIAAESSGAVLVHCVTGKDRTGVVCALVLALLGVPDDDIDADYALSARANVRYAAWARRNRQAVLPGFSSPRGSIRLFLSGLRAVHGTVDAYLIGAGLDVGDVAALRAHLLE
ncbi:tyrosine-protein phosphatase [Nonomuraea longispora]|uniref:Tyrosine-protein phosphatase n=1 Tax=Nonomuraea longispora TaxID=1848320 RepID=A0A4V2XK66_9ACTN|nr:tyrosine-protein phosphatase [Nonomuraea longispora]TDC05336.1 tyrosine-protein phosphatase [Nonomuraea longispora]